MRTLRRYSGWLDSRAVARVTVLVISAGSSKAEELHAGMARTLLKLAPDAAMDWRDITEVSRRLLAAAILLDVTMDREQTTKLADRFAEDIVSMMPPGSILAEDAWSITDAEVREWILLTGLEADPLPSGRVNIGHWRRSLWQRWNLDESAQNSDVSNGQMSNHGTLALCLRLEPRTKLRRS